MTQTKSEVAGGAHAVLCARARHAPDGDDASRDKALKVIPLSQLRQIQREVRLRLALKNARAGAHGVSAVVVHRS